MQNNMVSIPAANMNGGLKAANGSGTVVGVGVAGTVLTNAQRVYLTPASNYHLASRQASVGGAMATSVGVVTTAAAKGANGTGNGANTVAASSAGTAGTVRYFSQFSKLPVQQMSTGVGQRKLLNGDTMVLVNGSKPLIFASPNNNKLLATTTASAVAAASAATATASSTTPATTTATTTITVPNGNRVLINKQQPQPQLQPLHKQIRLQQQQPTQQQQQQQQQPATVIDELQQEELHLDDDGDIIEVEPEEGQQQLQPGEPLGASNTNKSADQDAEPELDIVINNVVCSFSVRCHLKLRDIALNGSNVEYRRENGMVTMKLRRPYTTASIWSSGRITCTGATSESQAKIAARRYARCLSKLGFPTHFQNFRIVNVLGTCSMPWAIKIVNFSERHRDNASYEPELHPGVTYKMREPKATLKIFSTGSITVTAASVNDVESAIQHIYPLVHEFRKQRSAEELQHLRQKNRAHGNDDFNDLDQQGADDKDDLFGNNTAANSNASRPSGSGANNLSSASMYPNRRIDQYKGGYQDQTQMDRRHGCDSSAAAAKTASSSNSSGGDNICANARRRATECWATKLQNKRPRYNDPVSTATSSAGSIARTATSTVVSGGGGSYSANFSAIGVATGPTTGANKLRLAKPLMPVDVVLKQSSSRARNAGMSSGLGAAGVDDVYSKLTSFSPTDDVDDLIEEDDDDGMDMHF